MNRVLLLRVLDLAPLPLRLCFLLVVAPPLHASCTGLPAVVAASLAPRTDAAALQEAVDIHHLALAREVWVDQVLDPQDRAVPEGRIVVWPVDNNDAARACRQYNHL